jgi:hypothetical protein
MHKGLLAVAISSLALGACVGPYKTIESGDQMVGDLNLDVAKQWNEVPPSQVANKRDGTQVWTQHGELLDRFILIPDTPSGEPIFVSKDNYLGMPNFDSGMLPNEIEALVETSILKFLGESTAVVETSSLRPKRYPEDQVGFMFDMEYELSEGPRYLGTVGGLVNNNNLYLMIYLAATPHYYETYVPDALAIMDSARIDAEGAKAAALKACGGNKTCQKRVNKGG